MSRISAPATIEASPVSSKPFLEAVKKMLGSVPNLFRMVGNSPAALEGYLGLNGALAKGKLDAKTRERIALAVAEVNGCNYCLAAHTYLAKNLVKLDEAEIATNRRGFSGDARADAAVRFAVRITIARGHTTDAELQAVKAAGYSDAEVIEIISHVALNSLTNYINNVTGTDIDFPAVATLKAAA
ncbi:MAG: carboxymuconolactone decarboxylase family protein [Aestuariivirga sp.]